MLMSAHSLADVLDVAVLELPRLGVKAFYLSLFENVRQSIEWSRLVLAYDGRGHLNLDPGTVRFASRQLLPENLLSRPGPYGLVAEAPYSKEERLGFMLLDVDAAKSVVCGALRGLLSSALQGVILNEKILLNRRRPNFGIIKNFLNSWWMPARLNCARAINSLSMRLLNVSAHRLSASG